ncbi:MAG TPA: post-COAP-1 domain-containing protein [Anaerolineae bacterium]|nr:post-COAP-1 domain-containing protein [Anaerolineae bacterium]
MNWKQLAIVICAVILAAGGWAIGAVAQDEDPLDPAHNVPLACEFLSTPGSVPRSAKNIAHLANVCGFVGTDVEFQSRVANDGFHDYAFVGTMGAGTRIFDITDPAHPFQAGAYLDPGWQGDVQVRGDSLVIAFDPISGRTVHASTCLRTKDPNLSATRGGVDIVRLEYDPVLGRFTTHLQDCYLNAVSGGAHTATLHPSGQWLAVNTSSSGIEVVDLRGPAPVFKGKITSTTGGSAHDVSFSQDGSTMYVASPGTGTYIVDVSNVLNQLPAQQPPRIAFISQNTFPGGSGNRYNLTTAHQADTSSDRKILVFTDERGGGLNQTACNTNAQGIIGGAHFWALAPIDGMPGTGVASASNPIRLGTWFYPNPLLALDPLDPILQGMGRTERACTIHVFRNGGNGTTGPGETAAGFDGVSRLPARQLVTAHYGAGVWWVDFSSPPNPADGIAEDTFTDWGNTLGWNVMPGAEAWSAKEYKGFIYAGDMSRGFDVYSFTECEDLGCLILPTNAPGEASGGGRLDGSEAEMTILRGTAPGGKATFGFEAEYVTGQVAPSGQLTFVDHGSGKRVQSTSIDSFHAVGNIATFTGRATVNGVPGVTFFVEIVDNGEPGNADTFRLVLGDGYAAAGVLGGGNIQVRSGLL